MKNENENLISMEEFINRAKALGVDFGKGDPKNRLRYYVKLGLLPHAQRKSFNGLPPNGAYPESVLGILVSIDRKLKEGKSVLQIKRELEEEGKKKEIFPPPTFFPPKPEIVFRKIVSELPELKEEVEEEIIVPKSFFKRKIILFALASLIIIFFSFFSFIKGSEYLASLIAGLPWFQKTFQKSVSPPKEEVKEEIFVLPTPEPYLTFNADTEISGKLILRDNLIFKKNEYQAMFDFERLTENRTFTFPNASGVICLNTGNCAFLSGEVTSPGGIPNRLAKFTKEREIVSSSISDLYENGISIAIDERGNVGIGTPTPRGKLEVAGNLITTGRVGIGILNPQEELHVQGKIQATGDICTDLAGGRCLSTLPIFRGGGFAGIRGTGILNYLPLWTDTGTLASSIVYQANNKIGLNITDPNEVLTLSGALSFAKTSEPSLTTNFGKLYVGTDGKLYFKDEFGIVYNLTALGISGQGSKGQIAFWNSPSEILGEDSLFWDTENKRLGIGTKTPSAELEVVGRAKMTSFQLATSTQTGYVLTAIDNSGLGTWMPAPSGTIPSGQLGYTLRHDGSGWVADGFLFNPGNFIGIGTTSSLATLAVAGSGFFQGPLTISTSSLAQLILQYDTDNYLKFFITSTSSEILASKSLILNSLTGELKIFNTSLKKGDKILRTSIPIFKFPVPGETSSTTFVAMTKEISTSTFNSTFPPQLEGAQRKFAFLINFADNIPNASSSTWRIDFANQPDIDFEFLGQNLSNLEEGVPHLKDNLTNLLNDNWTLKAKVPNSTYKLRVFNIFLLVYDQIQ